MSGIRLEAGEAVRWIRLQGDAGLLTAQDIGELGRVIGASAQPDERAIVISGSDDFCVGRSAQALAPSPSPTLRLRDHMARPLGDLFNTIAAATLPVFAAVKGRAFGFGCALAGICDVTFAHPQATFALPEIGHDVPPTMAMRALLGKVDIKTLAYWTLSGRSFDAQRARACGLVTVVSDNPEAEALALARDLGRRGLRTVASIKMFLTSVHAQSAPTSHLAAELIAAALAERDRATKS